MVKYDYIIVGAGFFGSICAYELNKLGKNVLVLEKRDHIGGNCFTQKRDDINLHIYGPHIFHTSNEEVWSWINQFVSFNNFVLKPVAHNNGKIYSLPFNMWTFNQLWGVTKPQEAIDIIKEQSKEIGIPTNLEEQAIKLVGKDVYETLIKGYTEKQWMKDPKELPPEIIKRLPVRFTYDNNYFNDKYQGIPMGGYTQIFDKLLNGIEVKTNVDFLSDKESWESKCHKIIYTGPIDKLFDYQFGELEYKTTIFEHKHLETDNYQGVAMVNYTNKDVEHTRIIEHKHFEFGVTNSSWVTWEYPETYNRDSEPFYPVNDSKNNNIYEKYKTLSSDFTNYHFGGRLAQYKYYDMDQVIDTALKFIDTL